jgi:hypothetical protein
MHDSNLFSAEHIELAATILVPIGSGILYLMRQAAKSIANQARMELKIDLMWAWFTNEAHELTGYQPGDEYKRKS